MAKVGKLTKVGEVMQVNTPIKYVFGIDGKDGKDGKDGINGKDGKDGRPGKDGRNGRDGRNGVDGESGRDGKNGKQGLPGRDGKDGKDGERGPKGEKGDKGEPGRDGRDGVDGKDGKDAPQMDEIISMLKDQGVMLAPDVEAKIKEELGKIPMGAYSGGGGGFHKGDLPGYKGASNYTAFGIDGNGNLGFFEIGDLDLAEYTRLIDTNGNFKYVGEALPGTATSAATWRIKRIEFIGGLDDDIEVKWADGVSTFTKVWDDRATYTYS